MSLASVRQHALALPISDRVVLLEELCESIDNEIHGSSNTQIAEKWAAESESRIDAVDQGKLPTIDGSAALEEFRRTYSAK